MSFSLLPAVQGNYILMFHIRGQQTFSGKSHIIDMLAFSTKWQNWATILHGSLIAFLYFSLKYVKTILIYGLYKGRWQSRFGPWAGICQSCSASLSILDIIRFLTLAILRGTRWWLTMVLICIILITKEGELLSLDYWFIMFPFLWNAGWNLLLIFIDMVDV